MSSKLHCLIIACLINIFPVSVCGSHDSESLKYLDFQELSTDLINFPTNGTDLPLNLKIWNDNRIKRQVYRALSDHGATFELYTMQKFKKFSPMHLLTIPNTVDVVIFPHVVVGDIKELLAVAIEIRKEGNILTVFQLGIQKDWKWHRLEDDIVTIGTSITFHEIEEGTILVIHEKNYKRIGDCLAVYLLDDNRRLKRIQNILIEYEVSTIILKMLSSDLFLVVSYSDGTNSKKFIALYKWRGFHFDQIQVLETSSVVISLSVLDNSLILAVSVYNDDYGQIQTTSLVFSYTEEIGNFTLCQKIPTIGSTWVGLFSVNFATKQELFLLFVNNIISGDHKVAETMIYKMSKNIFQPFQSIKTKPIFSWHPFQARNSEFLLISKIADTPLIYQYNGWKFELVSTVTLNIIHEFQFTKNIQLGSNSMILSIEKNNNRKAFVYKAIFIEEIQTDNYSKRLEGLCAKVTNEINNTTQDIAEFDNYNRVRSDYSAFENSVIEKVETQKIILGGNRYIRDTEVKGINDIVNIVKSQHNIVNKLSQIFLRYVKVDYFQSLKSFTGSHMQIMNKNNLMKRLNVNTLNGISFNSFKTDNFLKKSWQLKDRFIDNLEISKIQFQEINRVTQNHFHELVNEYIRLNGLEVKGDMFLKEDLHVGNKINNVFFDLETIVMKSEDQHLRGHLIINDLAANKLVTSFINLMSQEQFLDIVEGKNMKSAETFSFHTLRIKNLSVYGFFGHIEFTNINKHLLYKYGNQQINNTLQANIMKSNILNGPLKKLDFYSIRNSNIILSQKIYLNNIKMKSIMVQNSINNIIVKNYNLNVLLLESMKSQNFHASLYFNNIEIMGKVRLSNEIKRSLIGEINASRLIKYPLRISGDFEINGNIIVSDGFFVNKDIFNKEVSVKGLLASGIKLTELVIEIPVIIKSEIEINNIEFDLINAISSRDLLNFVAGDNISFAKKVFESVNILGQCDGIQFLNRVNLEKFLNNALSKNLDQIITGKITFAELHVKCIETNTSQIDGTDLKMLIKYEEDFNGISVLIQKDLSVQTALRVINIKVKKNVAGFNLNEVIFDTLYSGLKHYIINSNKIFNQPLYIFALIPRKKLLDIKAKEILSIFNGNKEIKLQNSTYIYNTISAYNIIFTESLDGINTYEFGKSWLLYEGNQEFTNKQIMSVVNIMDSIKITSKKINEYDVDYFETIVKINDNVKLQTLKSEEIISNRIILPNNIINEINLNQILLKKSFGPQTVTGLYNFEYSLMIAENFLFSNFFQSPMQQIDNFLHLQDNCKTKLNIQGRAIFHREPRISVLGNIDTAEIENKIWFLAANINFKYDLSLRNLAFLQGLSCESFFNNVNISEIVKTYLSKSQDQGIPGKLYLKSTSIVNVESQKAYIEKAHLSYLGYTLKMFAENIWFTHQDMLILNSVQMNALECSDCYFTGTINEIDFNAQGLLKSEEIVNKLNLNELKTFGNMIIENLVMKPTSRFNEIDMNEWFNNAVLKSTKLQKIFGFKKIGLLRTPYFRTITIDSLKVPDDILLTNTNTTLSGNKWFRSQLKDVTYFQNITLFHHILPTLHSNENNL